MPEAQLKPFAEHETDEWIQVLANPEEASFLKEINETVWCALALAPWKHRTRENAFCPTLPFNTQKGSALLMHRDYVTNYALDEAELQPKMETSAPWLPSEMRVSHHHDMFKWHVVFSTVFPDSLKWSLNKGTSSELPPTTLSSIQISHWHRRMSSDWTWPQVGSRLVWGYNLAYLEWPIVFCHGFFKKSLPEPFLSSHLVHLNPTLRSNLIRGSKCCVRSTAQALCWTWDGRMNPALGKSRGSLFPEEN